MRFWSGLLWCCGAGVLLAVLLGCGSENGSNGLAATELTVTPSFGTNMTLFQLTATGLDAGGERVSSIRTSWDWDDDGAPDTPYINGAAVEHVFTTPGMYTVCVTARDEAGRTTVARQTIEITEDDNPMLVTASVSPDSGTTQTVFTFRASGFEFLGRVSTRDQLMPSGYLRWDWEDDGVFDTPFKYYESESPPGADLEARIEHRFTTPGVKRVRVQLQRWDGDVGSEAIEVTVTE